MASTPTTLTTATFLVYALFVNALEVKHLQKTTLSSVDDSSEQAVPEKDQGIEKGCSRGHDCGYLAGVTKEPLKVPCQDGEKWMSPNAVVIRGHGGNNAIYCSVPKVGTSYTFGVMQDLKLPVKDGKRNAGYESVGEIVSRNLTHEIEQLCKAFSFVIIRNPWERIVSAYVDKVLTREVFREAPSFKVFLENLENLEHPELINQHFRAASETCHTSGEKRHVYSMKIKLEDNLRGSLEKIFVDELYLQKNNVLRVLDKWETMMHPTTTGSRWTELDKSLNSSFDRTHYYFSEQPGQFGRKGKEFLIKVAAKIYKDDIEFGHYKYDGNTWLDPASDQSEAAAKKQVDEDKEAAEVDTKQQAGEKAAGLEEAEAAAKKKADEKAFTGFNEAGSNCNCGTRVKEWKSGERTAQACAHECKVDAECLSFGFWSGSDSEGYCALFDAACPGDNGFDGGTACPKSLTNTGSNFNTVYNKA